ncbi:methylaspartate mutase [Streptosporangium sp. OZ121]|uniref:methylaspartate mutase n=1 Tax=Streptosporangium sp. OZ121 TaxID=3444183 RepID=UPI003F7B1DDF
MTAHHTPRLGRFAAAVAEARAAGELLVQPRMGFSTLTEMAAGLNAVGRAQARTVGTITLDSYTRVGDHDSARRALVEGAELNGFPIVAHGGAATRAMIVGAGAEGLPIQVRHGTPLPLGVVEALIDAGLDATEGGPVSYCLPYSRTPLNEAVRAWAHSCEVLAENVPGAHLESFGGCMLGQLCPPSLLVALSVLEGLFFRQHGLHSISLSYAQQTDFTQDVYAIRALRRLAAEHLGDTDWHVVLYTYMGVFPRTPHGALELLRRSARLAAHTGTERLIVKTPAEAHRIPTIGDNVQALEEAWATARTTPRPAVPADDEDGDPELGLAVHQEARVLVEAVLNLHPNLDRALREAFRLGILDVPYCLHADNAQRARSYLDAEGRLRWLTVGRMPLPVVQRAGAAPLRADDLLGMLSHLQRTFDRQALTGHHRQAARRLTAPGTT